MTNVPLLHGGAFINKMPHPGGGGGEGHKSTIALQKYYTVLVMYFYIANVLLYTKMYF